MEERIVLSPGKADGNDLHTKRQDISKPSRLAGAQTTV
jgi:hypothetical protein